MPSPCNVLFLGASYGSLLGAKIALAGHDATLVCLPAEVEAINRDGARVRLPTKSGGPVEIDTRQATGSLRAIGPADVDPSRYDLVALAMQEPQYGSPGVRELLAAIGQARVPCMSVMNMPPLTYLHRIPGVTPEGLTAAYTDPGVWQAIDPDLMTLCSPDPQAFRPPGEPVNVLQVTLPTNFKVARFVSDDHTAMLRRLQADIEAIRFEGPEGAVELPVKLKVHDSVFVPLAKWAMLLAGNYRCVTPEGARNTRDAVHGNLPESKAMYDWVNDLCVTLGAAPADLVPFEKYAAAAESLSRPASAARALFAGARNIERVDRLVQAIGAQIGRRNATLDATVALVDAQLAKNRAAA